MAPTAQAPPVLDFSVFYGDDAAAKTKLVNDVRECCLHNGFFQIVGHRVPAKLQNEVLESLKAFFALSLAEKEKVHKDNTTWNRGYENIGSQILEVGANPDQKEGFYVGEEITKEHPYFIGKKMNSGPNQWPEGFDKADLFRKSSMQYYDHMHALARDVLSVVAQTLYLDANYFADFTEGAVATLRYLHYPPQPKDSDEKLSRGIGAHLDFGSVTLLMQDEVDGLQVWEKSTEQWLDVAPIKGAYVVNLGNMFMRWSVCDEKSASIARETDRCRSNDRYISNLHRVINKSGRERYSVPFFYSGNPDYKIDCLPNCREEGTSAKYPPITVMECIEKGYKDSYGKATAFKNREKIGNTPAQAEGPQAASQAIAV